MDTAVGDVRAEMRRSIHACCSNENTGGSSTLLVVAVVLTPEVVATVEVPAIGMVETLVPTASESNGSGRVIDSDGAVKRGRRSLAR